MKKMMNLIQLTWSVKYYMSINTDSNEISDEREENWVS